MNGHRDDFGIPPDILGVSNKFPAPSTLTVDLNPTLRKRILDLLPPQNEARYLCEQAAEHAAWQCVSVLFFHFFTPAFGSSCYPTYTRQITQPDD